MPNFSKKLSSLFYSFSTQDRYADFQSHEKEAGSPYQTKLADVSTAYITAPLTDYSEDGVEVNEFQEPDYMKDLSNNEGIKEVLLAWRHISSWALKNHPDLNESLSSPCTRADMREAEKDLNVKLPACVESSLRLHDGQEKLPGTNGLVFGLELMDLDSVVTMTKSWRKVSARVNNDMAHKAMMARISNLSTPELSHKNNNNLNRISKLNGNDNDASFVPELNTSLSSFNITKNYKTEVPPQNSIPPNRVQPCYAHPGWIPLLTDNAGNHIGVDLAPASKGKWGQVIIFGREFDTKYVLAPNWGDFLLIFANDLENGNWRIENDIDIYSGDGDLTFVDKNTNLEKRYLDVLKQRCQKEWEIYKKTHKEEEEQEEQEEQEKIQEDIGKEKKLAEVPNLIDTNSPAIVNNGKFSNSDGKENNQPLFTVEKKVDDDPDGNLEEVGL
ncbi:hypothetical protein PACTADRAFT_51599 [Pachysolen tannophilus NRRL Y-2460]|uniref:Knr4/Smi1-like domain-containing protein n=1 Tax=Pachysolen tannophilus NRRL Y-2460 TaxID=669874 RepID=A0A1E4TQ24_PACTA|nr:hypothetical protein PACTADRAFT_51599 [Pachysolen tannophilus NRRL Y-2460]